MESKRIRILLADDEPDVLNFLSYNLAKRNYQVLEASNGWEAVTMAQINLPDLIIMDVHMPSLSGIEACRMIKDNKALESTPVLFLTGDSDEYISLSAIEAGGDHYVTKPVRLPVLLSMVDELLK